MEEILAAFFGEIASRSMSFLIDKYSQVTTPTTLDQRLHNIHRLLQRVRIIVQEAEGRNITNQAMVHKLNTMRKEMYRGYFIVDNFRSQAFEEEKSKDHDVSHPFVVSSNFNSTKHLFFWIGIRHAEKELQQVFGNLNNIIIDASEFIVLLKNYSPMHRQPYNMHMFFDRCMLGRQMEMERIMNFLMKEEPHGTEQVGIPPIVGQATIGKSTLVAHVCNDARVCNNFTQILFITDFDVKSKGPNSFKDRDLIIHQKNLVIGDKRTLAIIEFSEDADKAAWTNYLASASCHENFVKIIITSRSSEIVKFGTTESLILNFLPPDAYWYFFKVLTFGSTDPKDHPKLESIAMEISRGRCSFMFANIMSGFPRERLNVKHWHMVRSNLTLHVANQVVNKKYPRYHKRMATDDYFSVYPCDGSFTEEMVPKTTLNDVIYGSTNYEGKFQVVALKSLIPPYNTYLYTCEILKTKQHNKKGMMSKKLDQFHYFDGDQYDCIIATLHLILHCLDVITIHTSC